MSTAIRSVTVIGTGVIGASWCALYLARGLDVVATDVAPGAEERLHQFVDEAWPALERLDLAAGASRDRLRFEPDLEAAIADADFIQENGPERLPFKQDLFARLDAALPPEVIIATSSSGLKMSDVQQSCIKHPERCVVAHPFNPPHLIPLVELVGGKLTSEEAIDRAASFYRGLGKKTIRLRKELPGHVANRLQAALFREVVHLVSQGVVSVADADTAVCYGPGLRWGVMGPTLLFHLGGGSGGIEHFFDQFTGPLTSWFHDLGAPELTSDVCQQMIAGVHDEVSGQGVGELAAERDEMLIGLLKLRA